MFCTGEYGLVGCTAVITAEPAVIHFGGIRPGEVLQQVVHITNTAPTATRVHVIPPDTEQFTVTHKRRAGSIAPGLSEQLLVQFSSQQLQYHNDCIRVHTEGGDLLIPLHAYPIMNTVRLPKRVDFGRIAIGETASKQVQLSCKVPLAFAFQVRIIKHNKCFAVAPLAGTVPANGSSSITVTFTPASMTTEETQIEVLLSEHNPQPMTVTFIGSAMPGLARDRVLATAGTASRNLQQEQQHYAAQSKHPASNSMVSALMQGQHDQPREYDISDQHADVGSSEQRTLLPAKTQHSKHATQQMTAVMVDGISFPVNLTTQHDINSVLNQQPGRLRMKDIKGAIADRKLELQQEQQQLQAVLAAGAASGVDPFDQPDIPPAIKEALFQMQLKQCEVAAKRNTGLVGSQSSPVLGQEPPSQDNVRQLQAAKQAVLEHYQQDKQEAATHRLQLSLQQSGALHVLEQSPPPAVSAASQTAASQVHQAHLHSSRGSMQNYPGLTGFRPQWLLLESNEWRKRVQVAQRFVHAVRVVMYQNRAQARLKKLKLLTARLQGKMDELAGVAMHEVVLEHTVMQRPENTPAELHPDKVRLTELPMYRSHPLVEHAVVPQGTYGDFELLQQRPYQAEFEWKLLNCSPEDYPGLIPYLPPCKEQPLVTGAGEELPSGLPCGVLPAGLTEQEIASMPEKLTAHPFSKLEIGDRYTNDQVFKPVSPAWGMQADTLLQPRLYEYHNSVMQEQTGSGGVKALAGAPHTSCVPFCCGRSQTSPRQVGAPKVTPQLLLAPDPAYLATRAKNDSERPDAHVKLPTIELHVTSGKTVSGGATQGLEVASVTRHRALDDVKRQRINSAVGGLVNRVEEYNRMLSGSFCLAIKL